MQIHTFSYHPRPQSPQHDDQRKWQDQYWKARRRRQKIVTLSLHPSVRSKGVFIWHFIKVGLFLTIKAQLVVSNRWIGKACKKKLIMEFFIKAWTPSTPFKEKLSIFFNGENNVQYKAAALNSVVSFRVICQCSFRPKSFPTNFALIRGCF